MNETSGALTPLDAGVLAPLPIAPALVAIDHEAAGIAELPGDHPAWQRDVVSISSRARAVIATIVPAVVRTFSYWDHRVREVAFGARTLGVDPAGCYRFR
jgi:hypothetical protein